MTADTIAKERGNFANAPDAKAPGAFVLIALLGIIGLVARVAPLFDAGGRRLLQWPTEDGYLTLQIARNMAMGLGMSVSEGTIQTNGTQPFATFVWSLLFRLVDGDKEAGVLLVLLAEVVVSIATALVLFVVARRFFAWSPYRTWIAALAASAWFASPVNVPHTMNCLESGWYAFSVVSTIFVLQKWEASNGKWSLQQCLGLGLMLGWVFWVRNDGVFLILGVCVAHWLLGVRRQSLPIFGRSLVETLIFGGTSVVVASPWLYSNYANFGHLMPISGVAESHGASFGHNLHLVPTMLSEYLLLFLPVPNALEQSPMVIVATSLFCVAAIWGLVHLIRGWEKDLTEESVAILVFGSCLVLFYGLYFGASHFMNRYMFPLSPFLAMAWAGLVTVGAEYLRHKGYRSMTVLGQALIVLLAVGLQMRVYRGGPHHGHRQVIEWVEANVSDDVWVGAIQTGTLGFFHDKTYNLDGKVSPEALRARLDSSIPHYVVEKDIRYLVDWVGITKWANNPPISEHFEVHLVDKEKNLAVLRRVDQMTRENAK